jgi:hypothetical protein
METHLHVIQPFQAPPLQQDRRQPDRRRREAESTPFELESKSAKQPAPDEAHPASAPRAANEEGVGMTVDVEA